MHEFFYSLFGDWVYFIYLIIGVLVVAGAYSIISGSKRDAQISLSNKQ